MAPSAVGASIARLAVYLQSLRGFTANIFVDSKRELCASVIAFGF